jgi:hypothetical protein
MQQPALVKALFDTTTLCAAIQRPTGLSMQLLEASRLGRLEPVFSQDIIAEWVRHCRRGFSGDVYSDDDIAAFCELLEPILSPDLLSRVEIGRAMSPLYPIADVAGVTILQAQPNTRSSMLGERVFGLKDIGDQHVVRAALQEGCNYLCTYNFRDLPDGLIIGELEVIRPERLLPLVMALGD